ncbi:glutathione S-transferase family protein [Thalassotalea agarivorans]|uniref:Glutathione S-transferase n=1 Tax=Thalassotalea agarivorans TaxID=349064 RepID=A0A1H9ZMW5_THASX|nr:glutathione S-transferase family protein [Thalassotalea agarivorans]SES82674.1 glutathione S-transferase [Thalassotalea agarivorans]
MIKVVSFRICPFVQRVTALLEAKNVPYEIEYISLSDKPQWFLDISPNGQVPLLVTENGTALFESDAIAEYLDDQYAPIVADVSAEQKALDRAWTYQATKHYLVQCGTMSSKDKETFETRFEKLSKAFAKAEKYLAEANHNGPFWHGDYVSNVDMAWFVLLHRAHIVEQHSGLDFFAQFPRVKAWQQALMATQLPESTVSDDFVEKFSNFYLSENTYLGRKLEQSCAPAEKSACSTSSCCG